MNASLIERGVSRGATWLLVALLVGGCKQTPAAVARLMGGSSDDNDPCRYLTPAELQPYVGDLASPPYRYNKDDGVPDALSDACLYRGRDGQSVVVTYAPSGAKVAGTMSRRIPSVLDRMLQGGQLGAAGKAVMKQEPGPWDNATWFPNGSLMVYKGEQALIIDVMASAAGENGALALGKLGAARLGQPLAYDGAAAVAQAPKPHTRLKNACDLVPKAKAETALGAFTSAPQVDSTGTICTYHVHGTDGDESYAMAISWSNGYAALNQLKRGTSMVGGLLGAPAMPQIPAMDSATKKMATTFFTAVLGKGAAAPIKNDLKTDTALVGPWDSAALVNGMWVMAVKHDVAVAIQLTDGDYGRAKALIAAACEQL